MSWWSDRRKKLFTAKLPDLKKYLGKMVTVNRDTGEQVKIDTIVGNVGMTIGRSNDEVRPTFYEINGKYLVNMLRFHAEMEGDKSITEEQFQAFENMEFEAEKMDQSPERPKKLAGQL